MQKQVFRVVLDTNQIVGAGTRWLDRRPVAPRLNPYQQILIAVAESHTGLYCGKIIGEYLEKLVDRRHPPERALKMITYIMGAFQVVEVVTREAPMRPTDPDDEIFLLCAIDGQADYLVSEDHSLLDLKQHYSLFTIGKSGEIAPALGA